MVDAPSESFTRLPTYFVTWLFTHLTDPGWHASGLGVGEAGKLVTSRFVLPDRDESVLVINALARSRQVRVEGLSAASYFAAVWNREGKGELHGLNRVDAHASAATVDVPPRGLVALSTRAS